MKISDSLKNFVTKVRAINDVEYEYKLSQQKQNNANVEKKDKIEAKIMNLKRALLKVSSDLENKKISPLKRIILQLKLDMIESQLDKQNAKLDIENFKETALKIRENYANEHYAKIEDVSNELVKLHDKRKELDNEIAEINTEIIEEEIDEEQIFNSEKTVDEYRVNAEPKYVHTTSEEIDKILTEKENQLKETMDLIEDREDKLYNLEEEFKKTEKEMKNKVNNKLVKYNPIRLSWESFKSFMARAARTIFKSANKNERRLQEKNEWEPISKEEFENAGKNSQITKIEEKEKIEENVKDTETAEIKKTGIETVREANIKAREENKNSQELTADLIGKIQNREDSDGYAERIVEKMKEEAQQRYDQKAELGRQYNARREAMQDMNKDVQNSIINKAQQKRNAKIEQQENPEVSELRNIVAEDNLAIRAHKYLIADLEKKMSESTNKEEIDDIKLKIAAHYNDINDHRRIRDEKVAAYRAQKEMKNDNAKVQPEHEQGFKDSLNSKISLEDQNEFAKNAQEEMEEILRKGEEARQKNIKKQEEEIEK